MNIFYSIALFWLLAQYDDVLGQSVPIVDVWCQLHKDHFNNTENTAVNMNSMGLILRAPCYKVSLPLSRAKRILQSPHFDANKKVAIYVGGWRTTPEDDHITDMANAFNCRGDYNFMVYNTADSLQNVLYGLAAYNTEKLGRLLANVLVKLVEKVPVENIHLIGHSLGAHVVGYAGEFFRNQTNVSLARITGLDPSEPCFYQKNPFVGLRRRAAKFVDVIHTNPGFFGKRGAVGHADFYEIQSGLFSRGCIDEACSHKRSYEYFIETIFPGNEKNFLAAPCQKLNDNQCKDRQYPVGLAVSQDLRGTYVFRVNAQSPYGKNHKQLNAVASGCGKCKDEKNQ